MASKTFTTFEAAKICGVFHTTVINWVNKGKLKAHHTPGGHRRIPMGDLLEFMKRFDMPIPENLMEHRKKILIVEDDHAVQRMLVRSLQPLAEADIHACSSGLEALMIIGKEIPDVVVLDIRIPQVNGLEVCRLLKANENTREIKIIAVSGEMLSAEEEKFLRTHADHYFRKPLLTREFRKQVIELLDLEAVAEHA